jgi:hypothetical protein
LLPESLIKMTPSRIPAKLYRNRTNPKNTFQHLWTLGQPNSRSSFLIHPL